MNGTIYHVSEQPNITRFEPRLPPNTSSGIHDRVVWAIEDALLHNYLLPRDCPRVTFYPRSTSDPADIARLMGGSSARHIVAVERTWLPRIRATKLYLYRLPSETFTTSHPGAGYAISHEPVEPLDMRCVDDLLDALLERDVELRITPSLWPLRDLVIDSTLHFSIIRFRNAESPPNGYQPRYPNP